MTIVERVKDECKRKRIPIARLERECGFANGYIRNLREGTMPAERLQKIAEYLDLPYLYLLTGDRADGQPDWYIDSDAAKMAQEVFENPDLRILFDAAKNSRPEDIRMAAEMLMRFKGTNPDG